MQLTWGEMHLCVCVLFPHALPGTISCEQLWLGFPARRSVLFVVFFVCFLTHRLLPLMLRIIDRSIRQLFALKGREAEAVVLRDVRARARIDGACVCESVTAR